MVHISAPGPCAQHGARNEEESRCLQQLMDELQKRKITLPPEMIYAGDLEATLLRYCRARKYDLEKIIAMLQGAAPLAASNACTAMQCLLQVRS